MNLSGLNELLSKSSGESEISYLRSLQYVRELFTEEILDVVKSTLPEESFKIRVDKDYPYELVIGSSTIGFTGKNLDIKTTYETLLNIANAYIKSYLPGNLHHFRQHALATHLLNKILDKYEFLHKEVKDFLAYEVPDFDFLIYTLTTGYETFTKYEVNRITLNLLLESVKELGYEPEYDIEKSDSNKLFTITFKS